MSAATIEQQLQAHGINPTAARILVLKKLSELTYPVSMTELETELETMDKSTIFRTLNVLLEHHAVHSFEDGSGSTKYEICRCESTVCRVENRHIHFYCEGTAISTSTAKDAGAPSVSTTSRFLSSPFRKATASTPSTTPSRASAPSAQNARPENRRRTATNRQPHANRQTPGIHSSAIHILHLTSGPHPDDRSGHATGLQTGFLSTPLKPGCRPAALILRQNESYGKDTA